MTQYYVCLQWPSDKHPSLPYENINLVAGPFDQVSALLVRAEFERHHTHGSDADRDLNEYLYRRPNDYTSTDSGLFFIRSVEELRTQRTARTIRIDYYRYLPQYDPEILR